MEKAGLLAQRLHGVISGPRGLSTDLRRCIGHRFDACGTVDANKLCTDKGVLTVFLVGMVFADLWAASRRTKDIIKAREERMQQDTKEESRDKDGESDPFLDTLDDHSAET